MEFEINLCVETGCAGLCCQDIDLEITENERTRLFKGAKEVATIGELARLKDKGDGLYFTRDYKKEGFDEGELLLLSINGPCPNRADDGSCTVHAEREHAARNFKIGSKDCNEIRRENGLHDIFFEEVE